MGKAIGTVVACPALAMDIPTTLTLKYPRGIGATLPGLQSGLAPSPFVGDLQSQLI